MKKAASQPLRWLQKAALTEANLFSFQSYLTLGWWRVEKSGSGKVNTSHITTISKTDKVLQDFFTVVGQDRFRVKLNTLYFL